MGKSDEYQFDYLDDNDRFADQVNGALFKGRQVIKPEELEPADMQAVYLGKEAGYRKSFKTIVDKARIWRGKLIHILAIENQTYVDYHMVLRNMLSESLGYHKQWKQKRMVHEKKKEFITDYRLNLYDCYEHDTFDEYKTGLRQLFEVVRYGRDREKFKRILEENKEVYGRLDSDTRELIEVVGKVRIGKEYEIMENGEKKYDMCKAFMDMKLEGIAEGIEKGRTLHLVEAVCKKLQKNKPAAVIADELEEELWSVENVIKIQNQVGGYDAEQICEILRKNGITTF